MAEKQDILREIAQVQRDLEVQKIRLAEAIRENEELRAEIKEMRLLLTKMQGTSYEH